MSECWYISPGAEYLLTQACDGATSLSCAYNLSCIRVNYYDFDDFDDFLKSDAKHS